MRGVKVLVAVVVVALLGASAAFAATAFDDVPEGAFYDEPTAWAVEQGLTVGCNRAAGQDVSDTFCPLANVTRGENITFTYRHQTLVIDPLLEEIRGDVAAADVPDRVVWVADDGTGDFTSLSAALESITDASVSNPYVVRIAPGTYSESSTVVLKSYVDVEGSGEGVTAITCACAAAGDDASSATVSAGNIVAEIRHITIENTGGDNYSTGIWTESVVDGSMSMLHVTATATGAIRNGHGVRNRSSSPSMVNVTATGTGTAGGFGVYNRDSSSPSMADVVATGTGTGTGGPGYGVNNQNSSSPSMVNVTATGISTSSAAYGVSNAQSSSPSIRTSTLTGSTNSITSSSDSSAEVAATMLDGPVGGPVTCAVSYDENLAELNSVCVVT